MQNTTPALTSRPKLGRPTKMTDKTKTRILSELRDGKVLRDICNAPDLPDRITVYDRMKADPVFRAEVLRARQDGADALVETALVIADEVAPVTGEVQRARLRADVRMKMAAAFNQQVYGNRPNIVVQTEQPRIEFKLDPDKLAALAEAMRKMLVDGPIDVSPRQLASGRHSPRG